MAAGAYAAPATERSVSSSRQFIVYGPDGKLRRAICDVAERSKRDVLRLLGARDEWKTPVIIRARAPQANLPDAPIAQLHVSQTGVGLKFQLEFCVTADIGIPEVERELLRAIFLEMMYRLQPDIPVGTPYAEPPDWLLEGTSARSAELDSAFIARTLATALAGEMLALEEFLHQKRALLDSPSQALHRAYSAALASMLVESPEGRIRLMRFVGDLAHAPNDPLADLMAHFPGIGESAEQVEKTWRSRVTRLAGSERYRLLSCEETERQLAELLRIKVSSASQTAVYALEEFPQFLRYPAAAADLKRLTRQLLLLSTRANPFYRPIVGEYQEIAALLLRGRTRRISQRLAETRAMREHLNRQMNAIADYLNWFEATQARTSSGVFRGYLRAAELASEPEPRRRDPISVYLDALEAQF